MWDKVQVASPFNDGWTRQFYKDQIQRAKKAMSLNLVTANNIGGEVVKDNETYIVKDNKQLNNLVVSSTLLKPAKETKGHSHIGQEEVYHFIRGDGEMTLGEETFEVSEGDVVLIPDGVFHKVSNTSKDFALYFVCVFDGKRYQSDDDIPLAD
tara:strand:- start:121 stop:579 length:459 start_codon:yes stop_codon:yes gene_type:complete